MGGLVNVPMRVFSVEEVILFFLLFLFDAWRGVEGDKDNRGKKK